MLIPHDIRKFCGYVRRLYGSIRKHYGLSHEDNTKWSGISCDRELLDFLKHDDLINAIQEFFIEKLNELSILKKQCSLNWKT